MTRRLVQRRTTMAGSTSVSARRAALVHDCINGEYIAPWSPPPSGQAARSFVSGLLSSADENMVRE
jgi:hypothetical protein